MSGLRRSSILRGNAACESSDRSGSRGSNYGFGYCRRWDQTKCLVDKAVRIERELCNRAAWDRRLSRREHRVAPMFLDQGYAVLLPDSRAHGASGGQFVTYGLVERYDVIRWAHWIMRAAGCRKLYGLGESLGASILIEAAGIEPAFAAIVAECPYAGIRESAEYRLRRMFRIPSFAAKIAVANGMLYARFVDGLDFREVSPIRAIARTSTPILLIHGLSDGRTPPYNSERLARANSKDSLWLVRNALHTGASATAPQEFRRRVLSWFANH